MQYVYKTPVGEMMFGTVHVGTSHFTGKCWTIQTAVLYVNYPTISKLHMKNTIKSLDNLNLTIVTKTVSSSYLSLQQPVESCRWTFSQVHYTVLPKSNVAHATLLEVFKIVN